MYFRKEETEKPKTVVPFIYKGYRLYPVRKLDLKKYMEFSFKLEGNSYWTDADLVTYKPLLDYYTEKYEGQHNKAFFVFKDNEIVGELFVTDLRPGGRVCITSLQLLREHRGKGIGKGLMTLVEVLVKQAKCSLIELYVERHNGEVLDFYRKLGFAVRHQHEDGWSMVKDLLCVSR